MSNPYLQDLCRRRIVSHDIDVLARWAALAEQLRRAGSPTSRSDGRAFALRARIAATVISLRLAIPLPEAT